uniref:Topoisomerase 6 subunit A/Spo11 TOPRIM domain-containing protein n=1 Tax=Oryza barthii TaxID=65489 RepID=A0A0D3H3V7_9ORYZ
MTSLGTFSCTVPASHQASKIRLVWLAGPARQAGSADAKSPSGPGCTHAPPPPRCSRACKGRGERVGFGAPPVSRRGSSCCKLFVAGGCALTRRTLPSPDRRSSLPHFIASPPVGSVHQRALSQNGDAYHGSIIYCGFLLDKEDVQNHAKTTWHKRLTLCFNGERLFRCRNCDFSSCYPIELRAHAKETGHKEFLSKEHYDRLELPATETPQKSKIVGSSGSGLRTVKKAAKISAHEQWSPIPFMLLDDEEARELFADDIARNHKEDKVETDSVTYSGVFIVRSLDAMVTRECLNVYASPNGLISGPLLLFCEGKLLADCSLGGSSGCLIPSEVIKVDAIEMKSKIDFVLVVEKDTIFHFLCDHDFHKRNNCVLITGRGQAGISTRIMLRKLWSVFPGIPFLCLVDSNIGGANIFCTYRFGSEANAHDSLFLTVPELEFIGLDINDIPAEKRTALSDDGKDKDLRDLTNLMSKKYTYDAVTFRTNLKSMNELRSKADIEILMKDKNLEQYILEKIAKRNKGTQAKNEEEIRSAEEELRELKLSR